MSDQRVDSLEPTRDLDNQQPIAMCWRDQLTAVVEALAAENYVLAGIPFARLESPDVAKSIADNIADYGETIASVDSSTWSSSVAQWMDGYWDTIVDLRTVESGRSDLILKLHVYEDAAGYVFEVDGVYVP